MSKQQTFTLTKDTMVTTTDGEAQNVFLRRGSEVTVVDATDKGAIISFRGIEYHADNEDRYSNSKY